MGCIAEERGVAALIGIWGAYATVTPSSAEASGRQVQWAERTGIKVLVAEDDPAILELLVTRLEVVGYRTAEARDGYAALDRWDHFFPDVVLLDVNMPRLSGFGVLQARRDRGLFGKTPVLMLTARNARADVETARALGARDYLVKPFNGQDLLQRVAKLAKLRPAGPAAGAHTKAPGDFKPQVLV